MFKQAQAKRSNVTVDDRRAVLVIAQARKPKEVAEASHENFIRNALKDRLNWPRREQAPDAVKDAAKHMASALKKRDQEIFLKQKAAAEEQAKKEAEQIARMAADQERWEKQEEARIQGILHSDPLVDALRIDSGDALELMGIA